MLEVLAIAFVIMVASAWVARAVARCASESSPSPPIGCNRKGGAITTRVHQNGATFHERRLRASDDELSLPIPLHPLPPSRHDRGARHRARPGAGGARLATPGDGVTISGTVSNEVSGAGIGGISVQISKSDYSWFGLATTDAAGGYVFSDVLPGEYSVSVSLYVFPGGQLPYGHEPWVSMTISADPVVVDFALTPYASGTSVLTGSITDAQSGLPINGATISLFGPQCRVLREHDHIVWYLLDPRACSRKLLRLHLGERIGYTGSEVVIADASTATWDAALAPSMRSSAVGSPILRETESRASGSGPMAFRAAAAAPRPTPTATTRSPTSRPVTTRSRSADRARRGPRSRCRPRRSPTPRSPSTSELVARTTSFVSSAVFDENYNGIQYICVDLVDVVTGTVVESTETWADAVFGFQEVADGTYTLHLVDCAVSRPRIFGSTYLGGGTTPRRGRDLHDRRAGRRPAPR